jgi:hypothetical protein
LGVGNVTNDPIIAYTVSPECSKIAYERFARTSWIIKLSDPVSHVVMNTARNLLIQFL